MRRLFDLLDRVPTSVLLAGFVILAGLFTWWEVTSLHPREAEAQAVVSQLWYSDWVFDTDHPMPAWRPRVEVAARANGLNILPALRFDAGPGDHTFAIWELTGVKADLATLHNVYGHRIDTDEADAKTELRSRPQFAAVRVALQDYLELKQSQGCTVPADPINLVDLGSVVCP